jgi:glycosyltransferase involved in cell wall biosynthesis
MPKVSVIVPTFNQAAFLRRAVESICAQTFKDTEILLVDDGSEDATETLARQFINCSYLKIPHSGLPAVARNVGVRKATGRYIAFLDADDQWLPHKLHAQSRILDDGPDVGLVCSNALVESAAGTDRPLYLKYAQGKTGRVLPDLLRDNFIITSTVLMRRDLFESAGWFSEARELRAVEDYHLWIRVAAHTKIHFIPEPLALYQKSSTSLSSSMRNSEHCRSLEYLFENLRASLSSDTDAVEPLSPIVESRLSSCRCAQCDAYLAERRYGKFSKTLAAFLKKQPVQAFKYAAVKVAGKE